MLIEFSGRNEIPASYLGYAEAELWVDGFAGGLRSKQSPLCSLWCPQPERRRSCSCTAGLWNIFGYVGGGLLERGAHLEGAAGGSAGHGCPLSTGTGERMWSKQREKKKTGQNLRDLFWYIIKTENQKHLIDMIQYLNRIHQNNFWICSLIWLLWTFWVVCIF